MSRTSASGTMCSCSTRRLIKKLKGKSTDFYRLRADKYRVFYVIESGRVVILRVLSKKDAERYIRNLD